MKIAAGMFSPRAFHFSQWMAPPRSGAPNNIPVLSRPFIWQRRMPILRRPSSGSLVTQSGVR